MGRNEQTPWEKSESPVHMARKKRRSNGAEKRNAERIRQHKQRKQRQNVAESPYWQSSREGATDAFC